MDILTKERLLGASGYNGNAPRHRIDQHDRMLDLLIAEYDQGGMTDEEFEHRRLVIPQPSKHYQEIVNEGGSMKKISINDIGNYGRASGQTFRRLLIALYEASTGENVTYITGKPLAAWYMKKATDIARSYLSKNDVKVEGSKGRITICGKGYIQFIAIVRDEDVNRLRGLTGKLVEDD